MKRIRNPFGIFSTRLAVGAIATTCFVSSVPFPVQFQVGQLPFQPTAMAQTSRHRSLPIEHLIGIAQFVKNPTDYRLAHGEQVAQVTSASLEGDRMTIHYKSLDVDLEANDLRVGKLVGKLDSEGIFKGVFQTQQRSDGSKAEAAFAFLADGSAKAVDSKPTHILP